MQLHELISHLDDESLRNLAARCISGSTEESLGLLRTELEARIRQPDYVERTVFARRPSALAVLTELLAADGHRLSAEVLLERTRVRAARWRDGVTNGEILAQDDKRELYRKVLRAAWSNDLQLDPSEASLLGILRTELGLSRSEHFLLAFHRSITHLWDGTHGEDDLLRALSNHGLVWRVGDEIALADEMVLPIRRATGIELDESAMLRLLDRLNLSVLREVLNDAGLKKSGSKAELAERIVGNLISATSVLNTDELNRVDLVDLARTLDQQTSGKKHEIIIRIIECYRSGTDLTAGQSDVAAPLPIEPKVLAESSFMALLRPLSNHELHALLDRLGLPLSGTKEVRISQLWSSRFSETTVLSSLKGPQLGQICHEHGVSRAGKKAEQIERLLGHLGTTLAGSESTTPTEGTVPVSVESAGP